MDTPQVAIFDDGLGLWGPLTRTRPVFELRTGATTLQQRIERVLGRSTAALSVSTALAKVVAERQPELAVNRPLYEGHWLLVNGRWPALEQASAVRQLGPGQVLSQSDGQILAAHLEAGAANEFLNQGATASPASATVQQIEPVLLTRPWHLLDHLAAMLEADLAATRLGSADYHMLREVNVFGLHRIYAGDNVRIQPGAILNCETGPIAIDHGAHIHPRTLIQGPCYIGAGSEIMGHGYLRPNNVIGPHCKIGGEVCRSIIQGYSNKSHAGYLGDSILGQWCNLGASTVVSNLKNTYGSVRVQLAADRVAEDTGRTRHGPIIGDFVRTAIGSRLLTGSVIDIGNMLAMAGFAPKHAAPFGFYTDEGRAEHDIDKLLQSVAVQMQDHAMKLSDAEAALLRDLAG